MALALRAATAAPQTLNSSPVQIACYLATVAEAIHSLMGLATPQSRHLVTANCALQLGQMPRSRPRVQSAQNVHSKEQMRASALCGGRSRSQHSQPGRSCSILALRRRPPPAGAAGFSNPGRVQRDAVALAVQDDRTPAVFADLVHGLHHRAAVALRDVHRLVQPAAGV